jgi:hypothetical protein
MAAVSFPYSFLSSQACGGIRGVFPFSFGFLWSGYSRKTTLALIKLSAIKEKRNLFILDAGNEALVD